MAVTAPSRVQLGSTAKRPTVVGSFEGPIPRIRASVFYRLAQLVVAVAMALLPLIYLAIIAAAGYAVYYHAVTNIGMLAGDQTLSVRVYAFKLVVYVAPLVAGPILIAFMVKPLFARPAVEEQPLTLDRSQEPLLFAAIERLCETVKAPFPRRIDVDCSVNASAGFRRGVVSMFGRDLVLTIGLPLAAGLTQRQLIGVIAHELGHFSQGAGMRLGYVIRSIIAWFARVVYQRDAWDEKLANASRETDLRIGLILYAARLAVWLTRRVLWLLMWIGHGISAFMSRQMEFNADRYEAAVAGTETFVSTMRRLGLLNVAWHAAHADLEDAWRQARLADNLPLLVAGRMSQIPQAVRARVEQELQSGRAGLFSTHPSDAARIAHVRKRPTDGVFRREAPAVALFGNFKMIAHAVTLTYYRDVIGLRVERENLIPTERLVAEQGEVWEERRAVGRYFQGGVTIVRPLFLGTERFAAPVSAKETAARLKGDRLQFDRAAPRFAALCRQFAEFDEVCSTRSSASLMLRAGFRIDRKSFKLDASDPPAVAEALKAARAERDRIAAESAKFDRLLRRRLSAALDLLHVPAVAARIQNAEPLRARVARIVVVLARLEGCFADLNEARRQLPSLANLLGSIEAGGDDDGSHPLHRPVLRSVASQVHGRLESVLGALSYEDYPFEHAAGTLTVARYLSRGLPRSEQPGPLIGAASEILEKFEALYFRCIGRLALAAEQVEHVLKLPRQPEAPSDAA